MSTLYISDLDGTLLGPDARLSDETVATLNRLLDAGMLFTVATSRTPATVIDLLSRLHLRLPAVLMAGTLLYDIPKRRALAITCGAKAKHAAPTASMEMPPSAEVNSMALRTRPKRAAP